MEPLFQKIENCNYGNVFKDTLKAFNDFKNQQQKCRN